MTDVVLRDPHLFTHTHTYKLYTCTSWRCQVLLLTLTGLTAFIRKLAKIVIPMICSVRDDVNKHKAITTFWNTKLTDLSVCLLQKVLCIIFMLILNDIIVCYHSN